MRIHASTSVLLLSLGLFHVVCHAFPTTEVDALNSFKEAIYEDPHLVLSNWNVIDSDPCEWSGVSCSMARDHVIKLNITGASLKGFLAPELHLLSSLQELILHGNMLIGTLPREIGLMKNLQVLDLGMNQLTGPIPSEIGHLTSLTKLNLQSNGFTGRLPPELGTLKNLQVLRIDRNKLQGTFPASNDSDFAGNVHGIGCNFADNLHGCKTEIGSMSWPETRNVTFTFVKPTGLCRSSQLKIADFSFNFFTGNIPKCFGYLPRSSFQGNCLEAKDPKQRSSTVCGNAPTLRSHAGVNGKHQPAEDDSKHHASRPAWLLALEIVTGTMVGCLMLVALFTGLRKCKSRSCIICPWRKPTTNTDYTTIYIDQELLKDVTKYNRHELETACEDFSNIIGSSSDGQIFKGTFKGGHEIAVISVCHKQELWTDFLELYFQKEVADLARLRHDNAGKLLGYCRESNPFSRMLVFEYASNGTLFEHLHYGEACQLSWTRRMKIVLGIARGLRYLHMEICPPFTISELNSSAVYLTDDFSPKLVDFESWKTILSRSEKNFGSITNEGPMCVLPNAMEARHLDIQGNIYGFGVLLLEIISGRPPYSDEKGSLLDWAKQYLEVPEAMSYVVDPELKHFRYEDLKVVCDVINICIQPCYNSRTTMRDLCTMLEGGIDTSISAEMRASSLAWAELAISS